MKLSRRVLLLLLLTLPAAAQIPDSLTALNNAFRQAYAGARRRTLAGDGPLLIVNGDTAALVRGASRSDASINVPAYHLFKTIAHLPLAIFVALTPGEEALDPGRLKTLEDLRRLIPPARASLGDLGFAPHILARQDQIVGESLAFIDEMIAQHRFARKDLESFTLRMSPLVLANVADAVFFQAFERADRRPPHHCRRVPVGGAQGAGSLRNPSPGRPHRAGLLRRPHAYAP